MINKKALEYAINATPAERRYLFENDFKLFFVYYYIDYVKYPFASFHYEMFDDIAKLMDGTYREVLWCGFRECAKTSLAKGFITWLIATEKRRYVNVDAFDKENAERMLFDAILELQKNPRILQDYGELYNAKRNAEELTQKKISNFLTNNNIRVEAHSTQESIRGRLHGAQRPDCHQRGTKVFYKDKWYHVEMFQERRYMEKEKGIEVNLYSLPYSEIVTNTHRYWTKYIPVKTIKKTSNRKQIEVYEGWTEANKLTNHHYIGYKIDKTVDNSFVTLPKYIPGLITMRDSKGKVCGGGGGKYSNKTPKEFNDKDWWWLFGLWWGDGHLSGKTNNDNSIGLTIENNDITVQTRVINLLNKYNIKYSINPKVGCFQLIFSHAILGRWLRTWRAGNSMKMPPLWVEKISLDLQKELMLGYISADGFTDFKHNEVRITSVYLDGLYASRRILARLGIASSIREGIDGNDNYEICGVKCKTKKKYDLRFREGAKNLGFPIENQTRYTYPETFIKDGYLWSKVKKTLESIPTEFCPIQTEDHTYITHFGVSHNCLILDDFESNKTKDSEAYTAQVAGHISEAQSGMDANGIVLYLGNYITEYGNVAHLFERAKTDPRLKARKIDLLDENGIPTWPDKYTLLDTEPNKVSISDIRKKLGPQVFNAEMMNSPIDTDSQEFLPQWFKPITRQEVLRLNTRKFAAIDSAMSKRSDSDNTGIARCYVDKENKWYLSVRNYRVNAKEIIDIIFQLHEEGMEKIGIETTAYTEGIMPYFQEECRKRNKYPHIVELKHGGIQKETRIRGLIPRYSNGDIFHIDGECGDLEMELSRFPKSRHDDCGDATSYLSQICAKPYDTSTFKQEDEMLYPSIGI